MVPAGVEVLACREEDGRGASGREEQGRGASGREQGDVTIVGATPAQLGGAEETGGSREERWLGG